MRTHFIAFLLLFVMNLGVFAQSSCRPTGENLKVQQEFQDNRFGIPLHQELHTMPAIGEWAMANSDLNYKGYVKLIGGFYPSEFDANKWVAVIEASGAKHICFTTRHHEGFSMFDTKYSNYNIVEVTPFKRDTVKELVVVCTKRGTKLHFYYSHPDWVREDYPWGRTEQGTNCSSSKGDWKGYYQFTNSQLMESLIDYGPIGATRFGGWQDQPKIFGWELPGQYALIYRLRPGYLVGSNHHQTPFGGGDIQIFERDLPGENTSGLSGQEVNHPPLGTCETMNSMWGCKVTDQNYKSTKALIHYLVKAAGRNANLLMNIGPQSDRELPAVAVQRLVEMGEWMKQYGETIYGTRSGTAAPHDQGATAQKGNKLYIHIPDLKGVASLLPLTGERVKKVVLFKDQSPIRFTETKTGVLLEFVEVPEDIDYAVGLIID